MNITNRITDGMTPEERETYFAHMEMRHRQEKEYVDARRAEMVEYKRHLIQQIMTDGNGYTQDELSKKSIRVLEMINCYGC